MTVRGPPTRALEMPEYCDRAATSFLGPVPSDIRIGTWDTQTLASGSWQGTCLRSYASTPRGHCSDVRCTSSSSETGSPSAILQCRKSASSGREQLQRGNPLFDHDVGAQQEGFRDLQPDRLCRLEVDDQLEFRGLLNWNVFGMLAL